jgi:enoyl-CoA hydratase
LLITINRPEVLNATNDRLHWELTQICLTLDADPLLGVSGRRESVAGASPTLSLLGRGQG